MKTRRTTRLRWGDEGHPYSFARTKVRSEHEDWNLYLLEVEIIRFSDKPTVRIRFAMLNWLRHLTAAEMKRVVDVLTLWATRHRLHLQHQGQNEITYGFDLHPRNPFCEHAMQIAGGLFETLEMKSREWFETLKLTQVTYVWQDGKWVDFQTFLQKTYEPSGLQDE